MEIFSLHLHPFSSSAGDLLLQQAEKLLLIAANLGVFSLFYYIWGGGFLVHAFNGSCSHVLYMHGNCLKWFAM